MVIPLFVLFYHLFFDKYLLPNIPNYFIKCPIEQIDYKFNLTDFFNTINYSIIQLGMQYRNISTIFRIKSVYSKIWLPGTDKLTAINEFKKELLSYEIYDKNLNKVSILYTDIPFSDAVITLSSKTFTS